LPKVERDMVDSGGNEGVQITLSPNEVLPIPFSYLSLLLPPSSGGGGSSGGSMKKTIDVSFVSALHGNVVALLQVGRGGGSSSSSRCNQGRRERRSLSSC